MQTKGEDIDKMYRKTEIEQKQKIVDNDKPNAKGDKKRLRAWRGKRQREAKR